MASPVRMVSDACAGPIDTHTISVALPASFRRIVQRQAWIFRHQLLITFDALRRVVIAVRNDEREVVVANVDVSDFCALRAEQRCRPGQRRGPACRIGCGVIEAVDQRINLVRQFYATSWAGGLRANLLSAD